MHTLYVGNEKIEVDNSTSEIEIQQIKKQKEAEQLAAEDAKKAEFSALSTDEKINLIAKKLGLM